MTARVVTKRISLAAVLMFVFVGLNASNASAHVTVKPGEVQTASYQTFTVNVPNEKEIPTTSIRVAIPSAITGATPTQKSGWVVETKKDGDTVTEITWTGGEIGQGLRDEFTFSAKTPDEVGTVEWKAYQTYADGTVVAWDQDESVEGHGHEDESKGPLSVTSVIAAPVDSTMVVAEEVDRANSSAQRAQYFSIAAVVVALVAVFFATRKSARK